MGMGVGVAPVPVAKLTVDKLAHAISELTGNVQMQSKAASIGKHIRSQNGVERACEFIYRVLANFPKQSMTYFIKVFTTDRSKASLNHHSSVFIQLLGSSGKTQEVELTDG